MKHCEYKTFDHANDVREFINNNHLIEVMSITNINDKLLLFYKQ